MAGLLTWLMSKGDTAKRNLRAIARDPVGMLDLMAQQTAEDIRGTKYEREQEQARLRGQPYDQAAAADLDRKRQENMLSLALTFAGPLAKTANKGLLAKAQEMTKEGASPFDVWQQTGWTDQFPDRKWRFEIDDSGAKLDMGAIPEVKAPLELQNEYLRRRGVPSPLDKGSPSSRVPDSLKGEARSWAEAAIKNRNDSIATDLGNALAHQEAFGAYPMASRIRVSRDGSTSGQRGSMSGNAMTIGGSQLINESAEQPLSTTLHELQHAIQQREGFARGGSPQAFAKEIDPFDNYRRLAGEAESRLVQKRMNYTPEMRRAVAPWQQFDVPIDQQIVRFGDGPDMGVGADDLSAQFDATRAANKAKGLLTYAIPAGLLGLILTRQGEGYD